MFDKIYNFEKLEFMIERNYNSKNQLKVYAECGLEYNKTISIASPIVSFEFLNEKNEQVCYAKFKCTIALIYVANSDLNLVKRETMIELFQFMHAMAIGYFTNYNETKTIADDKIYLQPINYNEVVKKDIPLV